MADEVQATEGAAAPEGAQAAASKTKKINKLTAKELASKIEDIEKTGMTSSKYYKQLLQRKKEMGV